MPLRNISSSFAFKIVVAVVLIGGCLLFLTPWSGSHSFSLPFSKSPVEQESGPKASTHVAQVASSTSSLVVGSAPLLASSLPASLSLQSNASAPFASTFAASSLPLPAVPSPDMESSQSLAQLALSNAMNDASPIFGHYANDQSEMSRWMSRYPDATNLVHMNIPGAHDAATWNYSLDTQATLKHVTGLVNATNEIDPEWFRCQEKSLIDMLGSGVRAFDLRYACDVTKTTLVFWHGPALQSQTATLETVLFSFFQWLNDHPSEALFLSFQYEASERMNNVDDANTQMLLYEALTSNAARAYVRQDRGRFGTLGEARGKITLLRRFDLDKLKPDHEGSMPGIHFSPKDWTVNGAAFNLTYNSSTSTDEGGETGKAFIQDYYAPQTPKNSTAEPNIQSKLDAMLMHWRRAAASEHKDSLFWSFTSCTNIQYLPPITPRMLALATGHDGVNHRVVSLFESMKGRRLGIVMFDFFEEPKELISLFLSLQSPRREDKMAVA